MECDDTKSCRCSFKQSEPDFPLSQVHLVIWEKQTTDPRVSMPVTTSVVSAVPVTTSAVPVTTLAVPVTTSAVPVTTSAQPTIRQDLRGALLSNDSQSQTCQNKLSGKKLNDTRTRNTSVPKHSLPEYRQSTAVKVSGHSSPQSTDATSMATVSIVVTQAKRSEPHPQAIIPKLTGDPNYRLQRMRQRFIQEKNSKYPDNSSSGFCENNTSSGPCDNSKSGKHHKESDLMNWTSSISKITKEKTVSKTPKGRVTFANHVYNHIPNGKEEVDTLSHPKDSNNSQHLKSALSKSPNSADEKQTIMSDMLCHRVRKFLPSNSSLTLLMPQMDSAPQKSEMKKVSEKYGKSSNFGGYVPKCNPSKVEDKAIVGDEPVEKSGVIQQKETEKISKQKPVKTSPTKDSTRKRTSVKPSSLVKNSKNVRDVKHALPMKTPVRPKSLVKPQKNDGNLKSPNTLPADRSLLALRLPDSCLDYLGSCATSLKRKHNKEAASVKKKPKTVPVAEKTTPMIKIQDTKQHMVVQQGPSVFSRLSKPNVSKIGSNKTSASTGKGTNYDSNAGEAKRPKICIPGIQPLNLSTDKYPTRGTSDGAHLVGNHCDPTVIGATGTQARPSQLNHSHGLQMSLSIGPNESANNLYTPPSGRATIQHGSNAVINTPHRVRAINNLHSSFSGDNHSLCTPTSRRAPNSLHTPHSAIAINNLQTSLSGADHNLCTPPSGANHNMCTPTVNKMSNSLQDFPSPPFTFHGFLQSPSPIPGPAYVQLPSGPFPGLTPTFYTSPYHSPVTNNLSPILSPKLFPSMVSGGPEGTSPKAGTSACWGHPGVIQYKTSTMSMAERLQ